MKTDPKTGSKLPHGVQWDPQKKKYVARIGRSKRFYWGGAFDNLADAVKSAEALKDAHPVTPHPPCARRPLAERFAEKVGPPDENGCQKWVGATNSSGYGVIWDAESGSRIYAHRLAWESVNGEIPAGNVIDHVCHVRRCVNPRHLRTVSTRENVENFEDLHGRSDNTTGARGVIWARGRYEVRVRSHGKLHYGGRFTDLTEAAKTAHQLRLALHTGNLVDRQVWIGPMPWRDLCANHRERDHEQ